MKIACWSGPRNISTALLRSWSSRKDFFVSDEPFYAYYLKENQLKHPMYKEIINHYKNDYKDIVKDLTSTTPCNKKHWYQKHMAHHLNFEDDIDWIRNFENCILIRHPKSVISSYVKKHTLNDVNDLGYPQQYKIIKHLDSIGEKFIVIDSDILLNNPKRILSKWCSSINLEFDSSMLRWKKGNHSEDGIWWKHWYDKVINSTTFETLESQIVDINKEYKSMYDEALDYYKIFYDFCLK
tara:strand:- start:8938 stop:9654 length:717 start_codon:yes stop_codon:yes gene_type:complete